MRSLFIIIFLGLIGGCLLLFGAFKIYSSMHGAAISTETDILEVSSIDICELARKDFGDIRKVLADQSSDVVKSISESAANEACIFDLIDRLVVSESISEANLMALDSLAGYSDGFLTEYLSETALGAFNNNLELLLNYLISNQQSSFHQLLGDGISMDLSVSGGDKSEAENEAISKVESEDHKNLIKQIFNKVGPSKFD